MGFGNAPPTVDAAMTPVGGAAAMGRSGGGAVVVGVVDRRWAWIVWAVREVWVLWFGRM